MTCTQRSHQPFLCTAITPPPLAAQHDLAPYLSLLRTDGRLVLVGLPPEPLEVPAFALTASERVCSPAAAEAGLRV